MRFMLAQHNCTPPPPHHPQVTAEVVPVTLKLLAGQLESAPVHTAKTLIFKHALQNTR